ncbi:MAG: hypothetical protein JSR50_11590 [Proteobacteria bacterium]|nr:hypothetical protein [Pseudomonadota bacterium]
MSLIQTWIEQDHALVAVDTIGHGIGAWDGDVRTMTKLFPFPTANMLIACRGSEIAFLSLIGAFFGDGGVRDIDQAIDTFPDRVARAGSQFDGYPVTEEMTKGELWMVGWSDRVNRMLGACREFNLAGGRILNPEAGLLPQAMLAPGVSPVLPLTNDHVMLDTACRQLGAMKDLGGAVTGGDLMVARVERGRIEIRNAGPIPRASSGGPTEPCADDDRRA